MPTDEKVFQKINSGLSCCGLTYRKMMGEYLLYSQGMLFGGVYDGRLLIKETAAGRAAIPSAPSVLPYAGAKPMLYVDETLQRNGVLMERLIKTTVEALKNSKN